MKERNIALILMLFILPIVSRAQENVLKELESVAIIDQKIMMPMRDGIRLATDIYRPKTMKRCLLFFHERLTILILGGMANKKLEPLKEL